MKKRLFRNEKGFTLVELMIVVAVIGILAIVLLPKIGTIKTTSKAAGLDTNMRMAQAVVQAKISDYIGKGGTASSLTNEADLQSKIVSALSSLSDSSQAIKDPFNSWTQANAGTPTVTSSVYAAWVDTIPPQSIPTQAAPGIIFVDIYPSNAATAGSDINVIITPYDNDGNALTNKQVTIKP